MIINANLTSSSLFSVPGGYPITLVGRRTSTTEVQGMIPTAAGYTTVNADLATVNVGGSPGPVTASITLHLPTPATRIYAPVTFTHGSEIVTSPLPAFDPAWANASATQGGNDFRWYLESSVYQLALSGGGTRTAGGGRWRIETVAGDRMSMTVAPAVVLDGGVASYTASGLTGPTSALVARLVEGVGVELKRASATVGYHTSAITVAMPSIESLMITDPATGSAIRAPALFVRVTIEGLLAGQSVLCSKMWAA